MHYDDLKIKALQCINNDKQIFIHGFKILNNRKFIESHIEVIDNHRGNKNFTAFYNRLLDVVYELSSNIE